MQLLLSMKKASKREKNKNKLSHRIFLNSGIYRIFIIISHYYYCFNMIHLLFNMLKILIIVEKNAKQIRFVKSYAARDQSFKCIYIETANDFNDNNLKKIYVHRSCNYI